MYKGNLSSIQRFEDSSDFFNPAVTWVPEKDFDLCLNIGLCNFVLKVDKIENGQLALKPIYS
jgi:hypothetical protein